MKKATTPKKTTAKKATTTTTTKKQTGKKATTAAKGKTTKIATTAKKKTTKEASATGKIAPYYLPSPHDKKILDISQDFLLRLYAIPTVSKIAPLEIMSLLSVLARYPKRTYIPKTDIDITIIVPGLFADHKAKYIWDFVCCELYLSVSCVVNFDESDDFVELFSWDAYPGMKSTFAYNRKVRFKDSGPEYEKSIWEFIMEYDFSKTRMNFGLRHKGYYSQHDFRVK